MAIYKINSLSKIAIFTRQNYTNIQKDFWIYKFEFDPKKLGYEYSLIDEVKQQLPSVLSIVYLKGKKFFALFNKQEFKSQSELDTNIKSLIGSSDDITFYQVDNIRDFNEINTRHLAQLLLNSLATKSETNKSNITGGLYCLVKLKKEKRKEGIEEHKRKVWQYITLKLELDYQLHLGVHVKTFSSILLSPKMRFRERMKKFKDYAQYRISSGELRTMHRIKYVENNKVPEEIYINAVPTGEKNTVPFLDFSDYDKFSEAKCGILYEFKNLVIDKLKQYINLPFNRLNFSEDKLTQNKEIEKVKDFRIKKFYHDKQIVISVAKSLKNDDVAEQLVNNLVTFLTDEQRNYKAPNVKIGNVVKGAINIRIIHHKDYYEINKLKDEYKDYENCLVHHITIEGFKLKMSRTLTKNKVKKEIKLIKLPAIDVILKESYIKNDILNGKISIVDWNVGEWVFMSRTERRPKDEKRISKKDKKYAYKILKVSSDGSTSFTQCEPDNRFKNEDFNRLKNIYQQNDDWRTGESISGLLVSQEGDINIIYDTAKFTIQDIDEIGELLSKESDTSIKLEKENLSMLVDTFLDSHDLKEKQIANFKTFKTNVEKGKKSLTSKEVAKLLSDAKVSKSGKQHSQYLFCSYIYKQAGIVIKTFFKGEKEKEELFGSRLDICYSEINKYELYYFVGEKSTGIQSKFQNATNIRRVKAVRNLKGQPSKLVFKQLLSTLNVDFVKQGNFTVYPFPFKYLREYGKLKII